VGKPLFPKLFPAMIAALSPFLIGFAVDAKNAVPVKPIGHKSVFKHGGHPWKAEMTEAEKDLLAARWRKWEAGNNRLQCGDYSESIKIFTDLINTAPKKTQKEHLGFLYAQRGYARMLSGEFKPGIADATKALELDPNSIWTRKNRALAYRKLGLYAQANADLQVVRAMENDPKQQRQREIWGHYKDAMELRNQDRPEEVIKHAQQLIKDQPHNTAPYFMLGDAYFELGKFPEALAAFNKSLAIVPQDPYALNYRGTAYAQLGQVDKAIADYTKVIEIRKRASSKKWDEIVSRYAGKFIAPSLSELFALRAELYVKNGDRDKALADCAEAIKLNPSDDRARFVRATVYRQFKQTGKALNDLDDLLKLNPKDEKALQYKAEILLDNGKHKEAIVAITKAIELDDTDWHSFEIRAQCHQSVGNGKLAAQDIHQLNLLRNKH
jgi:tetratricopeptide (TPR) repeat protein